MRRADLHLEPAPDEGRYSGECRCRFRSVPQHYHVQVTDLRVSTRDGVELAVKVFRPGAAGKWPAIVSCNPYRMLGTLVAAPSQQEYCNHTHAPHYLAQHGYACVSYDIRGTGNSGGSSSDMYSDADRRDAYDMVEWAAAQPWSSGNVGMWGFSYAGVMTWQVAAMAPPHLKAILVGSGTTDVCRDWTYPGGSPRPFAMFGDYASTMAAWNFAPPDRDATGPSWSELWNERLQCNVPWSIAFLEHQTEDEYWLARSVAADYDRIRCPVFVLSGWADYYASAELRAFAKLKGPKKALIGPWAHYWPEDAFPGPRLDGRPEYLKWFDQFLKGVDTGVLKEPPVTVFVVNYQAPAPLCREASGVWRSETTWPPARTRPTPVYLGSNGRLEWDPPASDEREGDSYAYRPSVGAMSGMLGGGILSPWGQPLDQRPDEAHSLTYTSAPLANDMEVTGTPLAELFVSSSADVAYFIVKVCDVAPDGTSRLVSDGGLNATRRNSHSHPVALQSDQVHELAFELKALAYVFQAGHRIRVTITSADFQNSWPVGKAAVNTIMRSRAGRSRVILPILPQQSPLLALPDLAASPNPLPDSVIRPEYVVTHDLINQSTTVRTMQPTGHTTYTVSDVTPAEASLKSVTAYVVPGSGAEIRIEAQTVTESDAKVFRHLVAVEITVDGRQHFSRSWNVCVPRCLN